MQGVFDSVELLWAPKTYARKNEKRHFNKIIKFA